MFHDYAGTIVYPVHNLLTFTLENDALEGVFDKLLITKPGPRSFKEAFVSPERDKWMDALTSELKSHYDLDTIEWFVVDKNDKSFHELPGRVLFVTKYNDENKIEKFKCRMIVKGMKAIPQVNYDKTFEQTSTLASVRLQIALAVQHNNFSKLFDSKKVQNRCIQQHDE